MKLFVGEEDSDILLFDDDVEDEFSDFGEDVEEFDNNIENFYLEELNNFWHNPPGMIEFITSAANSAGLHTLPNFILSLQPGEVLIYNPLANASHMPDEDDSIKSIKYLFAMNLKPEWQNDINIQNILEELPDEIITILGPDLMEFITSVSNSTAQHTLPNFNAQYPLGTILQPQSEFLLPHYPHANNIHLHVGSSVQDGDEDDSLMCLKYLFSMNEVSEEHLVNEPDVVETTDN